MISTLAREFEVTLPVYIGLDIGGTKFMAAAAGDDGVILCRARADNTTALASDLRLLDEMIAEVAGGEPVAAIGAAIGGPIDWQSGVVSPLHQPDWRSVPLKQMMQDRWGCPFYIDVDTNVAVLGEYFACQPRPGRLLYITLSTGMGGGFLVDGKLYRGSRGAHPEISHMGIPYRCANPAGIQCECGVPDCLEALISGNGIRRIYGKPAEALSADEWSEVAFNLGQGLRNLAVIYTPDAIRLGGGVAIGGGEAFIQQAAAVMRANLRIVPAPEVALSCLGYDTALIGALAIAIHGLVD